MFEVGLVDDVVRLWGRCVSWDRSGGWLLWLSGN